MKSMATTVNNTLLNIWKLAKSKSSHHKKTNSTTMHGIVVS